MPPTVSVPLALSVFTLWLLVAWRRLGPRRAAVGGVLYGTLFLPVFELGYEVPLLKTKGIFVGGIVLLMTLLLDRSRVRRLRRSALDIPAVLLCVAPFLASISNDLGAYDGAAAAFSATMYWGAPYVLGRIYLTDLRAMWSFGRSIVVGALLYAPLCLWEVRMSPELHRLVFGIDLGRWDQAFRFGGYRPSVFMAHGLMLGMFLTLATLVSYWLWRTRAWQGAGGVSAGWCCAGLAVTTLLSKSAGAIVLLLAGIGVLEATRRWRRGFLVVLLVALPSTYCVTRVAGWSGDSLVSASALAVNQERAGSLAYRIANEDLLIDHALRQPWFGWGSWGRNKVHDENGRDITVVDGMWIGLFGSTGVVGLAGFLLTLALPVLAFIRRYPVRLWADPRLGATAALAIGCALWGVDETLNAMSNPLFLMAAGGLVTIALSATRTDGSRRTRRASPQVVTAGSP